MKKVSKINFVFGIVLSLFTLLSLFSSIAWCLFLGLVAGLTSGIISIILLDVEWFLIIGLPIMGSMLPSVIIMTFSLVWPFIMLILNILGVTKLGTKKGLNIVQLIVGGLSLINGATLPALFLVEGAAFGMAAGAEEKQLKQEAEAEEVQEETLEELEERM